MSWYLLFPLIFTASFVLTMVGLGGGLIFSPLFILLGFPVHTAVSASLFLNGVAAISAAITYFRKRMVDVGTGAVLIVSSTLFAPLGAYVTSMVNIRLFTGILAFVIFVAALRMIFSGKKESEGTSIGSAHKVICGGLIGMIIGFMAGLLGIGGGVFIVPMLIFILKMPTKKAAATSMFIVIFSSFSGFLSHITIARPDWKFILLAAIFSFAGGQLGSRVMAEKLKGKTVRIMFGVLLLLFFIKLVQRVL